MVSMRRIREVGRRIGEQFRAERVILFGSYAEGHVGADSDVDLLVVKRGRGSSVDQSVEIRGRCGRRSA